MILSVGYKYTAIGVKFDGLVAFPCTIGLPEPESQNDVTIVVFCGVFVVFMIIPVDTCNVAIIASSFVKSATLTQLVPFQRNIIH